MSILSHILRPDYLKQPPAFFHPRILVGAGEMLRFDFARKYNITHVINCATNEDSPIWWRMGYPDRYVVLNAVDSKTVNILDWYPKFEEAMQRFLREGNGVVFVHCQAGINRSASLALAYCCVRLNMKIGSLVLSVKRQRPCILQNTVFMDQVEEFVNGRLQSEEAKRVQHDTERLGDARLSPSGDREDVARIEDYAGKPKE